MTGASMTVPSIATLQLVNHLLVARLAANSMAGYGAHGEGAIAGLTLHGPISASCGLVSLQLSGTNPDMTVGAGSHALGFMGAIQKGFYASAPSTLRT